MEEPKPVVVTVLMEDPELVIVSDNTYTVVGSKAQLICAIELAKSVQFQTLILTGSLSIPAVAFSVPPILTSFIASILPTPAAILRPVLADVASPGQGHRTTNET